MLVRGLSHVRRFQLLLPGIVALDQSTIPMEAILRTLREPKQPRKLGEEVVYTKSTWREVE